MNHRPPVHLSPEVVAAYLERTLSARERAEVQAHLAECAACRAEVVEAGRILRSGPPRVSWRAPRWAVAALVVLAALGGPLLVERLAPDPYPGEVPDRGAAATGRLELRYPDEDAILHSGEPVRFTWSAAREGATFRITLLNDAGGRVWRTEVGDTTVILPEDVNLPGPGVYFWYVDALGPDGRSQSSGPNRFVVR